MELQITQANEFGEWQRCPPLFVMGVTFLPEIYARTTSFPNIHFFTPDHFHDTRDICAVYRKNIYHHAQFQALLALLREIVPAIYRVA